jgi:hypothetical protein
MRLWSGLRPQRLFDPRAVTPLLVVVEVVVQRVRLQLPLDVDQEGCLVHAILVLGAEFDYYGG